MKKYSFLDIISVILRFIYRKCKRIGLKDKKLTIISNNCIAGIIYHDLGLKFNSPTINLFIKNKDFINFLEHFDYFVNCELEEFKTNEYDYPTGVLKSQVYGNVYIHFIHYDSFFDAKRKWDIRKKRIDMTNFFIIMELGIHTNQIMLEKFKKLDFKNKIAIINSKHINDDNIKYLDIYDNYEVGKILNYKDGYIKVRRYLDDLDYVSFFNKALNKK